MIRKHMMIAAAGLIAALGGAAAAKQYVDYAPAKGVWEVNAIEVDPNHIDDYLTGLRQSQTPGFEVMKKHGLIDSYKLLVRNGYSKGSPSVIIMLHFTGLAAMAPDKARDQMIEKEIEARFSDEQSKAAVAGYEKYRTFVDDAEYTEMTMM